MNFKGSGFSVDLPEGAVDVSSYTFSFPDLGSMPPTVTVRREAAAGLDLDQRLKEVHDNLRSNLPNARLVGDEQVKARGNWRYFTHVVDFGEGDRRVCLKELFVLVEGERRSLFIFSGTDFSENFPRFEPVYDAIVRSFKPD